MLWRYTHNETKVLLLATLLVASGYAFLLGNDWRNALDREVSLTANTVSVGAAVTENEYNTLAFALDARARELDAREAALATVAEQPARTDTTVLLLVTLVGLALLGLILMNFYLDHTRRYSPAS